VIYQKEKLDLYENEENQLEDVEDKIFRESQKFNKKIKAKLKSLKEKNINITTHSISIEKNSILNKILSEDFKNSFK
jgi:preprotein translocase subunit SecA